MVDSCQSIWQMAFVKGVLAHENISWFATDNCYEYV